MSRVLVRALNTLGAAGGGIGTGTTAYFADSFHRSDQPFFVGDRWICSFMEADTQTFATFAAAGINVAANQLVIANTTGGGSIPKCFANPIPFNSLAFNWSGGLAPPSFAEIRFITANLIVGGDAGFGVALMCGQNGGNCYSFRTAENGAVFEYFIEKFTNGVNATLVGPVTPLNAGDVIRLEITPSVGSNLLTYKRNGVTIGTVTDSTSPFTFGIPGLVTNGTGPGGSYAYDLFKCGTLPQVSTAIDFP